MAFFPHRCPARAFRHDSPSALATPELLKVNRCDSSAKWKAHHYQSSRGIRTGCRWCKWPIKYLKFLKKPGMQIDYFTFLQIMPSDRVQITMEPDGTARLVIPQCCMDDEGGFIRVKP